MVNAPVFGLKQNGYLVREDVAPVVVKLQDVAGSGRLLRVSPETIDLRWQGEPRLTSGQEFLSSLQLDSLRVGPFLGHVTSVNALDATTSELKLRFDVARGSLHDVVEFLETLRSQGVLATSPTQPLFYDEIADQTRIAALLTSLARNGRDATVKRSGYPTSVLKAVRWPEDGSLEPFTMTFAAPDAWVAPPFVLEAVGYNTVYRFDVREGHRDGKFLTITTPASVARVRHRLYRRVDAPPGYTISFRHSHVPDLRVERRVLELSVSGLSFATDPTQDLLYPGLELRNLELHRDGVRLFNLESGEVRYIGPSSRGSLFGAMRLKIGSTATEAAWTTLITDIFHATTRTGGHWSAATWDLYQNSGYFGLSGKDPKQFAAMRSAFTDFSDKLDASPKLGCQVAWPLASGSVFGTLSMLRVYQGAWLGYQMAKITGPTPDDSTPGRLVLRDLHMRAYEQALQDPNLRWVIAYPQKLKTWSRMVHYDYPKLHEPSGNTCVVAFRALQFDCNDTPMPETPKGMSIGVARPDELPVLNDYLRANRPFAYVDALDLTADKLAMQQAEHAWEEAGLQRGRTILVARLRGKPVAFAVLECAADGVHLYRLLDLVRLYEISPQGNPSLGYLLEAAKAWYRSNGKSAFVCFLEQGQTLPDNHTPAFEDMGWADMSLIAVDAIPDFLEYIYEVTAPRDADVEGNHGAKTR